MLNIDKNTRPLRKQIWQEHNKNQAKEVHDNKVFA